MRQMVMHVASGLLGALAEFSAVQILDLATY